jgi:hypothetical protein
VDILRSSILFVFGSTFIDDGSALNQLMLIALISKFHFAGEQNQGTAAEL